MRTIRVVCQLPLLPKPSTVRQRELCPGADLKYPGVHSVSLSPSAPPFLGRPIAPLLPSMLHSPRSPRRVTSPETHSKTHAFFASTYDYPAPPPRLNESPTFRSIKSDGACASIVFERDVDKSQCPLCLLISLSRTHIAISIPICPQSPETPQQARLFPAYPFPPYLTRKSHLPQGRRHYFPRPAFFRQDMFPLTSLPINHQDAISSNMTTTMTILLQRRRHGPTKLPPGS